MLKREQLHDYQKYCIRFMEEHPISVMILEMGLGKSICALTAVLDTMFDSFLVHKTLVIAPLRVARDVWPTECKKTWEHTAFLQMAVVVGDKKERVRALSSPADIYVINRENVKWLVEYLQEHKIPWPFDCVIIDELSSFKNSRSERYRYLKRVRPKIKRMIGLTGTPVSNSLANDLWGEISLLDCGERLGRFIGQYRSTYFKPASMNPYTGVVYNYVPLPGAEEAIYEKM